MAVYLLHISPPYRHAAHYLGFTARPVVAERVAEHLAGRGSPLIRAALAAGCSVTVAAEWDEGSRTFERRLKNRKDAANFCPLCGRNSRPIPRP